MDPYKIRSLLQWVKNRIVWFPRNPKHFVLGISDFFDVEVVLVADPLCKSMVFGAPLTRVGDAELQTRLIKNKIEYDLMYKKKR